MVDYKTKLGIDFDLSGKQIEILERSYDTIVRAVPGSGKTTILTLKIKQLLIDNPNITKLCCISYTNVNVDDLKNSCIGKIDNNLLDKVDFLTFHVFCLNYILTPFSYLYRSKQGFRPYKEIFNYKEHGPSLVQFLKSKNMDQSEVSTIENAEAVYYNFKYENGNWNPVSNILSLKILKAYLNFLNNKKLIDFNLINLFSLFVIQKNQWVRKVLNESIDWILIDEFQDVNEIQCKIIEEIRRSRKCDKDVKWFLVGDPNQSIYGFAGANPKSMYDIKILFNSIGDQCNDHEIKLDRTHRCPDKVFNFARTNYNGILSRVKHLVVSTGMFDQSIISYLDDLEIALDIKGKKCSGDVIIKNTMAGISEIVNLRVSELMDEEVCCIGITRFHSIDVYKQYKILANIDDGENFRLCSDLYKEFEDKYGFKYFSVFIFYLLLKNNFFNNMVDFTYSVNKYTYYLELLICEKIIDEQIVKKLMAEIIIDSCDLAVPLNFEGNIYDEFVKYTERLSSCLKKLFPEYDKAFASIIDIKTGVFNDVNVPTIAGFLSFINKSKSGSTFEIKHIHKIKGLEYDQVIVQRAEDLPHKKSNAKINGAIFYGTPAEFNQEDIYSYIQEINKLYVMLTRAKINLYLIINQRNYPVLLSTTKQS